MSYGKTLLWDVSRRPASYDFVTCLATAKTIGMEHVRFVLKNGWKEKDYTFEQGKERFKSIVEPAVALWGMDYSVGDREGFEADHFLFSSMIAYQQFGRIAKLPVKCEDKGYVTITLRKSRTPERNSKDDEWKKFAARCGRNAIIIPDYDEKPLALEERMALYAGAHMNFFVINGPATLCIHSEAPYLIMRTIGGENSGSTSPNFMRKLGITPGFQFPWANERQKLSYLDDTVENIEAEFAAMDQQRMAA